MWIINIHMNLKRLLYTQIGRVLISILLGLGLATLFHKVCKDKNCLRFSGPILSEIDGKIYQYNNKCYQYTMESVACDKMKRVIDVANPEDMPQEAQSNPLEKLVDKVT
jgi:hypothetical protein